MNFNTLLEAESLYRIYSEMSEIDKQNDISYWNDVRKKPKMGDWCLFKHIRYKNEKYEISTPILALIVGHNVWDMALVIEYVEEWWGWQINSKVLNTHVNDYYSIAESDKEVKHIQFWTDNIIILGHWKHKPTFSQLRFSIREYEMSPVETA